MHNASDEQLVALVQSTGNRKAFDQLFSRYDTNLRAFLHSKSSETQIDDLVQETYVKAFLNIKKFEFRANYLTWLFTIAFNELLQSKRKISIFQRLKNNIAVFMHDNDKQSDNTHELIDAQHAIDEMSTIQQQVFVYAELYGYSHTEISDKLALPLGSVKTYIKQAQSSLQQGKFQHD